MDSKKKPWKTRWNMVNDQRLIKSLYNNKRAANSRQMGSNINEQIHQQCLACTTITQQMGTKAFSMLLKFIELKIDKFCHQHIIKNEDKFPTVSEKLLDELTEFFDSLKQFKYGFDQLYTYGYMAIHIKPFQQKDIDYYKKLGVVKLRSWRSRNDRELLNYVTENPALQLDAKYVDECCSQKNFEHFDKDFVNNKLLILFFKYIPSLMLCIIRLNLLFFSIQSKYQR